jgi:ribonuclease HI
MQKVKIYTDGACSGNPGAGGWAAILLSNNIQKSISGNAKFTTNNRMELMAVIKALECLKFKCSVDVYSDSAYVINAFTQDWISSWIANNWRTSNKKSVQNKDLWVQLLSLKDVHQITFHKVKGHSTDKYNNLCDELAKSEIEKVR